MARFIATKTSQNHKIKSSQIPQPSPKSQKYLYVKYMVYVQYYLGKEDLLLIIFHLCFEV